MAEKFKVPRGTFDVLPQAQAVRRRIHDANWSLINAEKSRASLLLAARRDRERRLRVD